MSCGKNTAIAVHILYCTEVNRFEEWSTVYNNWNVKLSNIWLDIQYKDKQKGYPLKEQNVQKHGSLMDILLKDNKGGGVIFICSMHTHRNCDHNMKSETFIKPFPNTMQPTKN